MKQTTYKNNFFYYFVFLILINTTTNLSTLVSSYGSLLEQDLSLGDLWEAIRRRFILGSFYHL